MKTEQRLLQAVTLEWPFLLSMPFSGFAMVPIHPSCSGQDVLPFSSLEPRQPEEEHGRIEDQCGPWIVIILWPRICKFYRVLTLSLPPSVCVLHACICIAVCAYVYDRKARGGRQVSRSIAPTLSRTEPGAGLVVNKPQ